MDAKVSLIDERKAKMREFLGKIVTEALSWPDVEFVSVRLVSILSFEDDGYDGEVRLYLSNNRGFGQTISAMQLTYIRNPQWLIDDMKTRLAIEMAKLANQPK